MLKNLASSLFLSERNDDLNEAGEPYRTYETPAFGRNEPKQAGRVITTIQKAKQVRPLVEKCITIARKSLKSLAAAEEFATGAERSSDEWKTWRSSDQWQQWNQAIAPALAGRRRAIQLLGSKHAVSILFDKIAPRFTDRDGGYTRILRLAKPRLGDAGTRAILEFVGQHDRVRQVSERPSFADDEEVMQDDRPTAVEETEDDLLAEEDAQSEAEAAADLSAEDEAKDEDEKSEKDET